MILRMPVYNKHEVDKIATGLKKVLRSSKLDVEGSTDAAIAAIGTLLHVAVRDESIDVWRWIAATALAYGETINPGSIVESVDEIKDAISSGRSISIKRVQGGAE